MSNDGPAFSLRVRQNPYLAIGGTVLHAIVEIGAVDARGAGAEPEGAPSTAEVIIIDTSSSMSGRKVVQAAHAAGAAVDVLRDGVSFAVIAGESSARMVYPEQPGLAVASAATRTAAKRALKGVRASGGTSMSTWLGLADRLFAASDARLKHALMLTDGQNVEGATALNRALEECAGRFVCDCRGVGDDWQLDQLKQIAAALRGTWKPIAKPEELAADFREVTSALMRKRTTDVVLRIRKPPASKLVQLARVFPDIEDLMAHLPAQVGGALDVPLGAWAPGEQRAYHVRFGIPQDEINIEDEARAAAAVIQLVGLGRDGETELTPHVPVNVVWTRNVANALQIHRVVAQYTGQEELSTTMRTAMEALARRDPDAEEKLGRVVALAHRLQRSDILELISQVAYIDDPDDGVVRLRPPSGVPQSTLFKIEWLSTQTSHFGGIGEGAGNGDGDGGDR
jgi:Mg-chelatase subunit ChlD